MMLKISKRHSLLCLLSTLCLALAACQLLELLWPDVCPDTGTKGNTYVLVRANLTHPITSGTFRIQDLNGRLLWQQNVINPAGVYILNLGNMQLPTSFRILLTNAIHTGAAFDGDLETVVRDYEPMVVYAMNAVSTLVSRHLKNNPNQDADMLIAQAKDYLGLPEWYRLNLDSAASGYHFDHQIFLETAALHGSYENFMAYLLDEIEGDSEPAYSFANNQPRSITGTSYPPDHPNVSAPDIKTPLFASKSFIDRDKINDLAKRIAGLAPGHIGDLAKYAWDLGGGYVLDALGLDRSPDELAEILDALNQIKDELTKMDTEIRETIVYEALKTRYTTKIENLRQFVDDTDTIWEGYQTLITQLSQAKRATDPDGQVHLEDNPDTGVVVQNLIECMDQYVISLRDASGTRYPLGLFNHLHNGLLEQSTSDPIDRPLLYLSDAVRLREGMYFDSANSQSIYDFYNYYLARMLKLYIITVEIANYTSSTVTSTDIILNSNLVAPYPDIIKQEIAYGYFPDPDSALQLHYNSDTATTGYLWLVNLDESLDLQWESLTHVLDHFNTDGCHADYGELCPECSTKTIPCSPFPGCEPTFIPPCTVPPLKSQPPDTSWVSTPTTAAHPFSAGGHTDWRLPGKGGYEIVFDILPSTNVVQFLTSQGLKGWDTTHWKDWALSSSNVFWIEDYRTWTVTNMRSGCDKKYWYDCTVSRVKNERGAAYWPWPDDLLYYGVIHCYTWFPDTIAPTRSDKKWIGRIDDASEPTTKVVDPMLLGANLCFDNWPPDQDYLVYTCHTLGNQISPDVWQGFMVWPVRKVDLSDKTQPASKGYERYQYTFQE